MEKRGKKAQAQIITTILIILLVLAAIVIVWNVVFKTIKSSSSELDINSFLFKGEVSYVFSEVGDVAYVNVKRGSDSGEIAGVKL